jgi:hypothetical protein
VSRLAETVAPRRLGAGFRWLMAGSWTSSLGDGIALAAGPLLVASQTDDPLLVAMAVLLQQLPWLLFGLHAGALADRLDRRTIVVTVDLFRVAVLTVLCATVATDRVSITVVLTALFLLGTAEVLADNASSTLLPMLVGRADLALGNARLMTGHLTLNQLAGPPVGAALFTVGAVWPFLGQQSWSGWPRCCSPAWSCRSTDGGWRRRPRTCALTSPRATAGPGSTPPCAR